MQARAAIVAGLLLLAIAPAHAQADFACVGPDGAASTQCSLVSRLTVGEDPAVFRIDHLKVDDASISAQDEIAFYRRKGTRWELLERRQIDDDAVLGLYRLGDADNRVAVLTTGGGAYRLAIYDLRDKGVALLAETGSYDPPRIESDTKGAFVSVQPDKFDKKRKRVDIPAAKP